MVGKKINLIVDRLNLTASGPCKVKCLKGLENKIFKKKMAQVQNRGLNSWSRFETHWYILGSSSCTFGGNYSRNENRPMIEDLETSVFRHWQRKRRLGWRLRMNDQRS